jgi:hypothetical protein
MQQYRYPGTRPFSVNDRNLFFGRNEDIVNLSNLISLENIVVLYGKSGLGKTSLLNAGVIPYLKESGSYETFAIRFGAYTPDNSITPINIFKSSIQNNENENNFIYNKLMPKNQISQHQLWYTFKEFQLSKPENSCFIIIFDQFEELFTYPDNQVEQFKKELSELLNVKLPQQLRNILKDILLVNKEYLTKEETSLLYKSINLKIVFSIRSDRMSFLNRMTDYLPSILKKCFELQPLTNEKALLAITEPAKKQDKNFISQPFDYDKTVLNEIIDFLSKKGQQKIETFLLQIVCQYTENIVIKGGIASVGNRDLGDLQDISKNFYDNILSELPANEIEQARLLLEDGLILEEEERRLSLYEGQIIKQYAINKSLLQILVDKHLLRSEPHYSGGFVYEICHDTLVAPILKAKLNRKAKVAAEIEKQKQLETLRIANEKAEKERSERIKERKRQRTISLIIGIAAIISVTLAIFAVIKMKQAQDLTKRLYLKEAIAHFEAERFLLARQKYIYLRDTLHVNAPSINKRIDNCIIMEKTRIEFYKNINNSDSLIKNNKLSDLILADSLLKHSTSLNYFHGNKLIQSKLQSYNELKKKVIISELEKAKIYLLPEVNLRVEGKNILENIHKLDSANQEVNTLLNSN